MKKKLVRATSLIASFAAAASVACTPAVPNEELSLASAAHSEGAIIRVEGGSPFLWADSPSRAKKDANDTKNETSSTAAMRARLETWVDRVNAIVVAQAQRNSTRVVPAAPHVHVVAEQTFNAWAAGAIFSTDAWISGGASNGSVSGDTGSGFTFLSGAGFAPVETTMEIFGRPAHWPSNQALVEVWNTTDPPCDLRESSPGHLHSDRCTGSGKAAISAATPNIFVTSNLLANVQEKSALVVIAHELGHYYRAHSSSLTFHKRRFWYEERDGSHRPLPSTRAEEISTQYARVLEGQGGPDVSKLYHRRMVPSLVRLYYTIAASPAFHTHCAAVTNPDAWSAPFMLWNRTTHEPVDAERYQQYERALATCAERITLSAARSTSDELPRAWISDLFVQAQLISPSDIANATTLGSALESVRKASLKLDAEEAGLLKRLGTGRMGLYTEEQEADEVMFEIAIALGLRPADVFESWLEISAASERTERKSPSVTSVDINAAQCRKLYEAGFTETTADGKREPVLVPLGDLADAHHPNCYRLANLWRENEAHKYVVPPTATPFSPTATPSWASLQKEMQSLTGDRL